MRKKTATVPTQPKTAHFDSKRTTNQPKVRPIRNDNGDQSDSSDSDYCYVVSGSEPIQPSANVFMQDCKCQVISKRAQRSISLTGIRFQE